MTLARESEDAVHTLWPQLEDMVPPDLPPDVAVSRLVALARSLLIENRQLREVLALSHPPDATGTTTSGAKAA